MNAIWKELRVLSTAPRQIMLSYITVGEGSGSSLDSTLYNHDGLCGSRWVEWSQWPLTIPCRTIMYSHFASGIF